ncbi:Rab GTPase-activating protein 1-like [Astathelohania contejeani]|uniref:Rab GTPase-activating protein 1-like n=1 Tax=Astathelohania contejeani TaxID=164912 RepID=A0ABQ7I1I0_9MICR|nr:Rab GTPase-activating protein 1-like [Thelohania contejeani]
MLVLRYILLILNLIVEWYYSKKIYIDVKEFGCCEFNYIDKLIQKYDNIIKANDFIDYKNSIISNFATEMNIYLKTIKNDILLYNSNGIFFILYLNIESLSFQKDIKIFIKEQLGGKISLLTDPIILNTKCQIGPFYQGDTGIFTYILLDPIIKKKMIDNIHPYKKYYLAISCTYKNDIYKEIQTILLSNTLDYNMISISIPMEYDEITEESFDMIDISRDAKTSISNETDQDNYVFVDETTLEENKFILNKIDEIKKMYSVEPRFIKYKSTGQYGFITISDVVSSIDMREIIKKDKNYKQLLSIIQSGGYWESIIKITIPNYDRYRLWKIFIYRNVDVNYEYLLTKECGYEVQIYNDVKRTFRNHILFDDIYGIGACRLFKVMVAYANYNPKIGYCQGMTDIVALLLMYFPEKEAFQVLINIIEKNKLNNLYNIDLDEIYHIMALQEDICLKTIPNIYNHLRNFVDKILYMPDWYITLFTRFVFELTLRIWDHFLFYGFDILPFFGAAILKDVEKEILDCNDSETLLLFIKTLNTRSFNIDYIVKWVNEHYKDV